MIIDLFPSKILQRDINLSDEQIDKVIAMLKAIHATVKAEGGYQVACEEMYVFSDFYRKKCPEFDIILDHFVQGFKDLLDANGCDPVYQDHDKIKNRIRDFIINDKRPWIKLPFMQSEANEFKRPHIHEQCCVWGILYLQDIDHKQHGGQIYFEDPKRLMQAHFNVDRVKKVEAKKNRLMIVPNYLWHGVTPYSGPEERLAIVVSLPNSILE